ncbi:YafY family protein [Actinoplanes sp. NPDC051851]|uniref:helix-turn-helix transcriptional regulator n=1 Tax=Actinoplanes sp. NPDC051851 TaxID=3154753 RepID=UPI00343EC171
MTRPTARVLTLLEILQNGGTHTAPDLAERLGLDERTVRRYVGHLLDLEIPVESVRGRHGGYRLSPGFRMPPLMLTGEEALAVLLGLAGTSGSREAAGTATAKIRRVLPKPLAARLDALLTTAEFTATVRESPPTDAAILLLLAEATLHRRPAVIAYTSREGRESERTVHPYGIVAHNGRWYLAALDESSAETRTFRLDRVLRVRPADGTFTPPEDFRPAATVLAGLAATPWRHEVVVSVQGPVSRVRRKLPTGLAEVTEESPDRVVVRLRAEKLDWLPALLAGLDLPFVIHRPAELRTVVREWAGRIAGYATDTP